MSKIKNNNKLVIEQLSDNNSNVKKLIDFLNYINYDLPIPLSEKINFENYAEKVLSKGIVFVATENNNIIGLLTGYLNDTVNKLGYISLIGISKEKSGKGIGTNLLNNLINLASERNMEKIILNTNKDNSKAISFYEKNGFIFKENYVDTNRSKNVRHESDFFMEYDIENRNTNILLTSVGRRSYLVDYFKEALGQNGEVHVSNSSPKTPAFQRADYSVITPLIYEKEYVSFLLKYCKEHNIKAIISLFDIDLPVLSENKQLFLEAGIQVVVSDEEIIEICNDKLKTFNFLRNHNLKTPSTYTRKSEVINEIDKGSLNYPVIIKPRWGMGSIGIFEANTNEEINVLYDKVLAEIKNTYLKYETGKLLDESIIIQEKLIGQEYGLDIINDLDGNYQNTVIKKKYAMRSGETDAAITEENSVLKKMGKKISKELKHIGNLDVDVFMVEGTPYILELNARFGGGYPFSHAANVDLPLAIIKWLNTEEVSKEILTEKVGVFSHKDINIVTIDE